MSIERLFLIADNSRQFSFYFNPKRFLSISQARAAPEMKEEEEEKKLHKTAKETRLDRGCYLKKHRTLSACFIHFKVNRDLFHKY